MGQSPVPSRVVVTRDGASLFDLVPTVTDLFQGVVFAAPCQLAQFPLFTPDVQRPGMSSSTISAAGRFRATASTPRPCWRRTRGGSPPGGVGTCPSAARSSCGRGRKPVRDRFAAASGMRGVRWGTVKRLSDSRFQIPNHQNMEKIAAPVQLRVRCRSSGLLICVNLRNLRTTHFFPLRIIPVRGPRLS